MTDRGEPTRAWLPTVGWAALLVVGHVAALQLILQGTSQRFPHFRTWQSLVGAPPTLPLLLLSLQAAAVAVGLLRIWGRVVEGLAALGRVRLLILLAALVVLSATVAKEPIFYVQELILSSILQGVMLANALLLALSLPNGVGSGLSVLFSIEEEERPPWADRALWGAALFALIACALLSIVAYERVPHVPDELTSLVQAKMFASGRLWLPPTPVPEAFAIDLMVFQPDRWYSTFAPGWPAALTVGTFLGAPWLTNPVLTALNVLLVDRALRPWVGERTSVLAALLYAVSPWTLFLGMSFMSHAFTLACAMSAAIAVAKLREGGRLTWALVAGLGIGGVGLTRPLDAVAIAVPLGLWALVQNGSLHLVRAGAITLVSAAVGALVLPYNRALTGSARTFPVMNFWDEAAWPGVNALGFGSERGMGPNGLDPLAGHGPLDVLINANLNLTQLNVDLFGWGLASLLPLVFLMVRGRLSRGARVLVGFCVWVVAVQSLYYFSGGADFGARYWYLAAVPVFALSALGLQALGASFGDARARVASVCSVLAVVALVSFVPWRAFDRYRGYRGMDAGVRALAEEHEFGRSLVLIRGWRHPDYASAVHLNPLDLHADVPIYAWARSGEVVDLVLWEYRDRQVWVIDGPTQTGAGFRLVAGPVPASELLEERGVNEAPPPRPHLGVREMRRTVPEPQALRVGR